MKWRDPETFIEHDTSDAPDPLGCLALVIIIAVIVLFVLAK